MRKKPKVKPLSAQEQRKLRGAVSGTAIAMLSIPLSEQKELVRLEKIIENGQKAFWPVYLAWMKIRDCRLYRATHNNFEDYCQERWNLTRQHVNRLIAAGQVVQELEPMGSKFSTEREIRDMAAEETGELSPTAAALLAKVKDMSAEDKMRMAAERSRRREEAEKSALNRSEESNRRRLHQDRVEAVVSHLRRARKLSAGLTDVGEDLEIRIDECIRIANGSTEPAAMAA